MAPFFTVVIPSYLGPYPGAASDRVRKFHRMMQSLRAQTFEDWDAEVVADGCAVTVGIMKEYRDDERLHLHYIEKQPTWSVHVRNVGIEQARGLWKLYLDTDDAFGPEHLEMIHAGIGALEAQVKWVSFNDLCWLKGSGQWVERQCNVGVKHQCGTSNIAHRDRIMWPSVNNYDHDYHFVQVVRRSGYGVSIPTPRYFVMHISSKARGGGYDL